MAALTYGQRALLGILQRTCVVEIAARCGVTPPRVSEWVSGVTTPSARARAALWAQFRIPDDDATWGKPRARRIK